MVDDCKIIEFPKPANDNANDEEQCYELSGISVGYALLPIQSVNVNKSINTTDE